LANGVVIDSGSQAPIAVIGGGLAGLSASLDLVDAGRPVVLLERRPFAGGKAYSFDDPKHGVVLDNGQHITMRCCTEFQAFLERIDCADIVRYQEHLEVAVIDPESRGHRVSVISSRQPRGLARLGLPLLPAPLHMFPSMATYEHLSLSEKARLALAFQPIRRMSEFERLALDRQSFGTWLLEHGQTERVIERFWDLIVLPTCNDRCQDVSTSQAIQVFQEGFSSNPRAADIGMFTRGLGQVADAALKKLRQCGARVELNVNVSAILTDGTDAAAIRYGRGEQINVSAVILALPPNAAFNLIPSAWRRREPFWRLNQHEVSPIINVHMQWDRAVMQRDFVAALDPDAQFIFHRSQIHGWQTPPHWISVSLSGAHELVELPQQEIIERVERAVRRTLRTTSGAQLLAARVVKEAEATFRPTPGMNAHRVGPRTSISNLALAGAWTATGWPATMESAVRSGRAGARAILEEQATSP
jgi:squalene-associated FAD-dependent desaturase